MYVPFRKIALSLAVLIFALACEQPTFSGLTEDSVNSPLLAKGGVPTSSSSDGCTTIRSGTLIDAVNGEPIKLGYDEFGYNYQAHIFNGAYSDYDRVIGGDFSEVNLQMKWNDAWLSNKSCDGDNKLDRSSPYIGSGAWLTNHDIGFYEGARWTYFVKIVAVPTDAGLVDGIWFTADEAEIGPVIWGSFAVIQQVITGVMDPAFADFDLPFPGNYRSPSGSGLGSYK